MTKRLKAYQVSDGDDGCCVTFATNSATARREGANEIGCEWEDIDYCHRAPQFDEYAPGPVPPLVLIADGWWFECGHCGRRVTRDMREEAEDNDEEVELQAVADEQLVYCSPACAAKEYAERRLNQAAKNALIELIFLRYPECSKIEYVYVNGTRLEERKPHYRLSEITFSLPGIERFVNYGFGEDTVSVFKVDEAAFIALYGTNQNRHLEAT